MKNMFTATLILCVDWNSKKYNLTLRQGTAATLAGSLAYGDQDTFF